VFFRIYGDKRPKKISGRAIAAIWMFIGIIWFAGLTATLSSTLTLDRIILGEISDLSDLYGKKVAVIENTTSEDFLRYHNVKIVSANSLDDLIATLKDGRSDAIVYDAPPLMYAAKLNPSIIEIMISQQSGEYQKIYNKWF
jgi:polar amino acid transport system substrate-binding protein